MQCVAGYHFHTNTRERQQTVRCCECVRKCWRRERGACLNRRGMAGSTRCGVGGIREQTQAVYVLSMVILHLRENRARRHRKTAASKKYNTNGVVFATRPLRGQQPLCSQDGSRYSLPRILMRLEQPHATLSSSAWMRRLLVSAWSSRWSYATFSGLQNLVHWSWHTVKGSHALAQEAAISRSGVPAGTSTAGSNGHAAAQRAHRPNTTPKHRGSSAMQCCLGRPERGQRDGALVTWMRNLSVVLKRLSFNRPFVAPPRM